MNHVLNLILTHQVAAEVQTMLRWWGRFVGTEDVLLAYGGSSVGFDGLDFPQRVFIDDPALRTHDHPLERQSYTAVFAAASRWMEGRDFSHVYFAEYDHLPICRRVHTELLAALDGERADVLAHFLRRLDGTNHPHYLHECSEPRFHPFWESISARADRRTVLTMYAPGSFWTRDAFDAVAARAEPFPVYLEIYLPTLAHHLGFRVRDIPSQNRWIHVQGDRGGEIEQALAAGAWALHPVKRILPRYFELIDRFRES